MPRSEKPGISEEDLRRILVSLARILVPAPIAQKPPPPDPPPNPVPPKRQVTGRHPIPKRPAPPPSPPPLHPPPAPPADLPVFQVPPEDYVLPAELEIGPAPTKPKTSPKAKTGPVKPAPIKPAPAKPAPAKPAPGEPVLKELVITPPPSPAAAKAKEPDPSSGAIPKDADKKQIRVVGVLCTPDAVQEIAALMSYLQEIGTKIAMPVYLRPACALTLEADSLPVSLALKAKLADCVAVIAVLKGLSKDRLAEVLAAMDKQHLRLHLVESKSIRDRSVLVDIMTDLLLTEPSTGDHFRWHNDVTRR